MMDSAAFKKLKGSSLKVLLLFLRKVKTHNSHDRYSFEFPFTFPEAKKKGIPHSSYDRALDQLIELGFIERTKAGGMDFTGKKEYSLYTLSQRWQNYETETFKPMNRGYCGSVHGN
jgi:hypothetical protein